MNVRVRNYNHQITNAFVFQSKPPAMNTSSTATCKANGGLKGIESIRLGTMPEEDEMQIPVDPHSSMNINQISPFLNSCRSGYLWKRSRGLLHGGISRWQRRTFVLTLDLPCSLHLIYYAEGNLTDVRQSFSVDAGGRARRLPPRDGDCAGFSCFAVPLLVEGKQIWGQFAAESVSEAQSWVKSINSLLDSPGGKGNLLLPRARASEHKTLPKPT